VLSKARSASFGNDRPRPDGHQFGIPSAPRILHTEPPEKIVRAAWLRACLHSFVDQVNVGIRWMMFRKSICRCSVATNAKPLREIMRKNGLRIRSNVITRWAAARSAD